MGAFKDAYKATFDWLNRENNYPGHLFLLIAGTAFFGLVIVDLIGGHSLSRNMDIVAFLTCLSLYALSHLGFPKTSNAMTFVCLAIVFALYNSQGFHAINHLYFLVLMIFYPSFVIQPKKRRQIAMVGGVILVAILLPLLSGIPGAIFDSLQAKQFQFFKQFQYVFVFILLSYALLAYQFSVHFHLRQQQKFFSILLHDIRNPVHTILWGSSFLLDESAEPLDSGKKEIAQVLMNNANRIDRLIANILVQEEIEEGELVLQKAEIDTSSLLAEVAEDFVPLMAGRNITFSQNFAKDLPNMVIDKEKMLHVFTNLLENALMFTPNDGEVQLNVSVTMDEQSKRKLRVSIRNSGMALSKDNLAVLFSAHSFEPNEALNMLPGTGIGLASSKQVVEAHDGSIIVISEDDRGNEFQVFLPL